MSKRTYGSAVRKRTLKVLETLLQIANLERMLPSNSQIAYRWVDQDTNLPKVVIKTTITDLWRACNHATQADALGQAEVREALHALEKFLGILKDHRISTQGSSHWHFTLELWSTRTDDNVAAADRLWHTKQAEKKAGLSLGRSSSHRQANLSTTPQADWQPAGGGRRNRSCSGY